MILRLGAGGGRARRTGRTGRTGAGFRTGAGYLDREAAGGPPGWAGGGEGRTSQERGGRWAAGRAGAALPDQSPKRWVRFVLWVRLMSYQN